MPLTSKMEHFARLIALNGLNQSDAYRLAYNVRPDTPGTTYMDDASELARHPLVSPRIQELKASLQAEIVTDAAKILKELDKAGSGDPEEPLRWADKIAALDKMAKLLGLYPEVAVKVSGQVDHRHLLASWSDAELEALAAMKGMLLAQTVEGEIVEGELVADATEGEPA